VPTVKKTAVVTAADAAARPALSTSPTVTLARLATAYDSL
jgi:hypothetical protein